MKPTYHLLSAVAGLALCTVAASAQTPRPEHPRPDAFRANWVNLNGTWQFEIDEKNDGAARGLISGHNLADKIIVPFCPESKLSGLGLGNSRYFTNVWYRRMFTVPASMSGKRVILHFGAVDYRCWVYVNGRLAGTHEGESPAFGFDVTPLLKNGENELVVRVNDELRSGLQPGGKQSYDQSEGCLYTRTTGIWQTVWLEAVGSSYVDNFSLVPDPDHSRVLISASVNGPDKNLKLVAEAFANGKKVGSDSATGDWRNQNLVLNLSQKKLWEPGRPFLYDLKLTLYRGAQKVDELTSYFGLRKVAIDGRKILINDKPVFQRLILDQGFYPDGIWTAPSEDELKKDIERSMACGYNGARLHQKVFEPRFLYWADKMGYLVWGESPNWGLSSDPRGYAPYITEWTEVVTRDRNHPALIGWCPFNETPESQGTIQQVVYHVTKAVDPTRPILETSGWSHTLAHPEVMDIHDYDGNPSHFRQHWMDYFNNAPAATMPARYGGDSSRMRDLGLPFMISEIGGIGWATEGGWGYGTGPKTLEEFYTRYKGTLDALLDNPNMFGFCYTQLTDVEQEHNGLYYYDRRPKFDLKRIHDITARQAAYERNEPVAPQPKAQAVAEWTVASGAIQDGPLCTPYRYTTTAPAGEWTKASFDDTSWQQGMAPFGQEEGRKIATPWSTSDIYLRKSFELKSAPSAAAIVLSYDEDTEVFVNGVKLVAVQGFIGDYQMYSVPSTALAAFKTGQNTLAVHTRQTAGGQHIDLAVLVR